MGLRNELKWSDTAAPESPNKIAGWDAEGNPVAMDAPASEVGSGITDNDGVLELGGEMTDTALFWAGSNYFQFDVFNGDSSFFDFYLEGADGWSQIWQSLTGSYFSNGNDTASTEASLALNPTLAVQLATWGAIPVELLANDDDIHLNADVDITAIAGGDVLITAGDDFVVTATEARFQGTDIPFEIKSTSGRSPKLKLSTDGVDGDGRNFALIPEMYFGFYRGLSLKYSTNHLTDATTLAMFIRDNGNVFFGDAGDNNAHFGYHHAQSSIAIGNTIGSVGNWDFIQGGNVGNSGTGYHNIIKGNGYSIKGASTGNFIHAQAPENGVDYMKDINSSYLNAITTTNKLRNFGGSIVVGDDIWVNESVADNEYATLYSILMGNHNSALNSHHLFQFGTGLYNHYNNTDHGLWKFQPKFYFGNANVDMDEVKANFVIANGYVDGTRADTDTRFSNSLTHLTNGWTQINTTNDGFQSGITTLTKAQVTPKAAFEVVSDNSGILVPRLTDTEFADIDASFPTHLVDGLILYESTNNKFKFRQDGAWEELGGGGGAQHLRFRFNSSLYTEDEHLFVGPLTTLTATLSGALSAVTYEVRLDSSSTWTACANLAAVQTWITTNITSGTDKYWIKALATYSGTGTAEVFFTYI